MKSCVGKFELNALRDHNGTFEAQIVKEYWIAQDIEEIRGVNFFLKV